MHHCFWAVEDMIFRHFSMQEWPLLHWNFFAASLACFLRALLRRSLCM